jgi:quinol-cytochrome oxidoreductase complex cytochrome b subunit
LLGLVILHVIFLHSSGSSNPLALHLTSDKISFHPYFTVKDLFSFIIFLLFFGFFIYYFPNYLGHPDNYVPANPLVTPAHIVPE